MTNDLLPSADVCARLKIDRSTLSRWVAAARITPAMRAPGRNGVMFFTATDVEALAAELGQARTA